MQSKGKRERLQREEGFILITVYWLVTFLAIFAAVGVTYALADLRASQRAQSNLQAFYLAEAGVDWAITQFRNDPLWAGGTGALSGGNYTVALQDLGGNRRRITSQGTATQAGITAVRSVESIVLVTPNPLFRYGMFGNTSATLTGNANTDSYNSANSPYNAQTAGSHGDVGTNGISAGNVGLTGNAMVKGDVYVGTGGNPNTVITMTGNSTITGNRSALNTPQPMTPVTVPGGLISQGALSVSGNSTVTLPGGTYLYSSISVSGNGQLRFTGVATLYLTGTLSVSGNGIGTASNLPPNLLIYVHGNGNVSFTGNGNFYGAVYAPESSVQISGNGAFYGATLGKTITNSGNGGVHYDQALQSVGGGAGGQVQALSWQDLS